MDPTVWSWMQVTACCMVLAHKIASLVEKVTLKSGLRVRCARRPHSYLPGCLLLVPSHCRHNTCLTLHISAIFWFHEERGVVSDLLFSLLWYTTLRAPGHIFVTSILGQWNATMPHCRVSPKKTPYRPRVGSPALDIPVSQTLRCRYTMPCDKT